MTVWVQFCRTGILDDLTGSRWYATTQDPGSSAIPVGGFYAHTKRRAIRKALRKATFSQAIRRPVEKIEVAQ